MDPEDEDIIPPGAVEVPGAPVPPESKEVEGEQPTEANPSADEVPATEPDAGTYEIDGVKYTEEELEQVLRKGKSLHEYQKGHPGFDPWHLERDYRIKTAELAELKRAGATITKQPEVDLSEFDPEELERFDKIAKAKGLLSKAEMEEQARVRQQETYNAEKDAQLKSFLGAHPEYRTDDAKWDALMGEFNIYKLPANPSDIGSLLERAHEKASGGKQTSPLKDVKQLFAARKVTQVAATGGGGTGGGGAQPAATAKSEKLAKLRQHLKGFSEEELNNMAK